MISVSPELKEINAEVLKDLNLYFEENSKLKVKYNRE
jgi:hypothetical protein